MTKLQQIAKLEQEIAKRVKIIVQIIESAQRVLFKIGRETRRHEGDCHTHTENTYIYGAFEISGSFGQTMFGGNSIRIRYKNNLVFDVYWQVLLFSEKDGVVNCLEGGIWQKKLHFLASKAEEIVMKNQRALDPDFEDEKLLKELSLQAEKLGLTIS
jgi:hypothetical protein